MPTAHMLRSFTHLWRSSRTLRWGVTVGGTLVVAVALVLMFLLAQSTSTRALYERNYERLLLANLVVVLILFVVLAWMGWRIWSRYRRNKFGSRLVAKWVAVFVLVASLPGALIYLVSYQFVNRSIASWFDVKVETALDAGLSLGRSVLDTLTTDTATKAQAAAQQLGRAPAFGANLTLEQLRSQLNADHLVLWSATGERIASASKSSFAVAPESPPASVRTELGSKPVVAYLEGLEEGNAELDKPAIGTDEAARPAPDARIQAFSLVRAGQFMPQDQAWMLQVVQSVPQDLLKNALLVQDANREYQERALNRKGMQRLFIGTLTLTLILAVLAAVLLAALLATQLARPLLLLAEGVQQVAEGNLGPKPIYEGHDELGHLTHAFANMTQQLADAQQALTTMVSDLDASRSELQTILDNLSTGVLMLRSDGRVVSANPGACRMLGMAQHTLLGHRLADFPALAHLATVVQQQFEGMLEQQESTIPGTRSDAAPVPMPPDMRAALPLEPMDERYRTKATDAYWQHMLELNPPSHEGLQQDATTLVLRGALLPDAAVPDARLLVCEDISAIVSAQRAQAWGEVARRLAHEIKNPLTPIQLSAERLEMKLMDSLPPPQQAVLAKSVKTIVEQVDAMKRLVNEFRDYARLPAAHLKVVDLNALVSDVLQLYGAETAAVPIAAELDPACQHILADAEQLRQIIHNLLQNAQDAQEQAGRSSEPVIIQTQWRPATRRVRLSVLDAGNGFPEHILQRAFEPYVTTKAKGTGLGLAVVKKIADDHGARLTISNRLQDGHIIGAQVSLLFAPAVDAGELQA